MHVKTPVSLQSLFGRDFQLVQDRIPRLARQGRVPLQQRPPEDDPRPSKPGSVPSWKSSPAPRFSARPLCPPRSFHPPSGGGFQPCLPGSRSHFATSSGFEIMADPIMRRQERRRREGRVARASRLLISVKCGHRERPPQMRRGLPKVSQFIIVIDILPASVAPQFRRPAPGSREQRCPERLSPCTPASAVSAVPCRLFPWLATVRPHIAAHRSAQTILRPMWRDPRTHIILRHFHQPGVHVQCLLADIAVQNYGLDVR